MRQLNPFIRAIMLISALFSASVQAELVTLDWQAPDDRALIVDTSTRLGWLRLTETEGLDPEHVATQFGVGERFEGLRFATNEEVVALWGSNFGVNLRGGGSIWIERAAFNDPAIRWADEILGDGVRLFNNGYEFPAGWYSLAGYTADFLPAGFRFYNATQGSVYQIASENEFRYYLGGLNRSLDVDYFTFADTFALEHATSDGNWYFGASASYLVLENAVPLPPAAWLFGAGLMALLKVGARGARRTERRGRLGSE